MFSPHTASRTQPISIKPITLAATVLSAIFAFAAAPRALAQSLSGFTYNGLVYTSYQAGEYLETPQGPNGAAAIRATGAAYTSVVATQYVQTYTSNVIAPETASSPGYDYTKDPLSPTDAAVVAAIANLQAQGLTVVMKPQVDSLDGKFRGQFAPTNVADWFASYQTFILHYAQIASQNNVGTLIIGTEFVSLSGSAYKAYWENIIAQLRSSYPNLTLVYGANATYAQDEFTTVSFWDKVDIIGVDGYFPLTGHADPTVAELVAAWTNNVNGLNIVAALKNLQTTYNKPLIFTELGYVSAPGTNEAPYANAASGATYDPTEQNNCYEAFFEVFSQQSAWMKGVFWWAWNVSPPSGTDTGYTPQNKPAADVTLEKWYGSTTPGFTLAPESSVLNLAQGGSVSDIISVTDLGGFTGSVALSASGLPTGVIASFAAGTVAGTQVMTLNAASGSASGTASVTITGTSGSNTATTAIAVTVPNYGTAQTIAFANPGTQSVGTKLTLSATATSGLPVTFASTTPGVCTVAGSLASFLTAGTCTIDANQAGDSAYAAAPLVAQSFTVVAPSFTLAAVSPALSLAAGGSATETVTVAGANGFIGSVTLAATGLPTGVTASFATNPATSSSVVTFTATSAATPGPSSVTVTGTSGSLTATTTIALTVTAPAGFTLTPSSSSVSIAKGSSGTDSIAIAPAGGFTGSVALSAAITASPSGAQDPPTLSFGSTSPAAVTSAGGSATLTISTTAATTAALAVPTRPGIIWKLGGGALACILLFAIPARRRRLPHLLGALAVCFVFASAVTGCSSGNSTNTPTGSSGTTSGSYTITVTATSGAITSTQQIALTVQ
jgi:hypothetical protein